MEHFNWALTSLFSLLLTPLTFMPSVWGVITISAVAGVVLAVVYGKISNQRALKNVKRSIAAGIYESVLFRHDLATSLGAQAGMVWSGVRYFALAIPPILILLIPSVIILAQLNLRYGARSLTPGEKALFTVQMSDDEALFEAELQPSDGVVITPPLRDLEQRQVSWRVDTLPAPGALLPLPSLTLAVAGSSAALPLYVGSQPITLATEAHTSPVWQFLYPGGTVPEALRKHVQAIFVTYPEQTLTLAGIGTHWLILFICVSIASGLVASKVIGIEI